MTKYKFKEYYEILAHDYKIMNEISDSTNGAVDLFDLFKSLEFLANVFIDELNLIDDETFKLLDDMFNNVALEDVIGRYYE